MHNRLYYYICNSTIIVSLEGDAESILLVTGGAFVVSGVHGLSGIKGSVSGGFDIITDIDDWPDLRAMIDAIRQPLLRASGVWKDFRRIERRWKWHYEISYREPQLYPPEFLVSQADALNLDNFRDLRSNAISLYSPIVDMTSHINPQSFVEGDLDIQGIIAYRSRPNIRLNVISSMGVIRGLSCRTNHSSRLISIIVPVHRTPSELSYMLGRTLRTPGGNWTEFNRAVKQFENLKKLRALGLIKESEMPPEPKVENYV